MLTPFAKHLSLVVAVFLLPSCATVRENVTTNAHAQPAPTTTDARPTMVDGAQVLQTSYRQDDPESVAIEPTQVPQEIVPVPDLATGGDAGLSQLSLDTLEQMALENNPSIAEAWANVEAARGKWVQAGLPPNPRLGYSGQQLGSRGLAEQQGIYIEQEVIRGHKLRLNRAVASQEISHAEQLLEVQRRRVLTDVRLGYYNVLCTQKRLDLSEELVRIGNQATTAAEALLEKQEGSRRDLLQARIESRSAETFLQQARNQHMAAWRMLAAVLGTPDMPPAPLAGQLDVSATELEWDQSMQQLLSESPELSAALMEIQRARWSVDRAYAEAVPDLNVQGIIQGDNSTGSSNGALLVSLPIPFLNRNQGGIRQAESEVIAAERAAQRLEFSLQRRLAPVFERYLSGRNRVENYRDGILRDAQESLDLTRQGYQAGEVSFLNLLTAQRTYFQASLGFVDALCDTWAASTEIEGLLLTNSLEQGPASGQAGGGGAGFKVQRPLPNMAGKL